ncbi:MAG: F0F1 ATP synthase subunit A, partial [Candidatus Methylomirabilis sp.]|nr:F0F1 ATP synthase subunit A [Deltaproteobacteria bacterium]
MEHGFTWLGLFPAIPPAFQSNVTAALIALLVVLGVMKIKGRLATDSDEALLPDDRLSLRNVFELLVEGVRGLANNVIGHDGDKYLPLLGTIFIYILAMNLIGLVPGFSPPTSDFNVNMGMAATVFLLYNFYGFREHGPAYLK